MSDSPGTSDSTSSRAAILDDGDVQLYHGDVIETLRGLPAGVAQTCVTSPPYWGLRDYGTGEWSGGDAKCDHVERVMRPSAKSTLEDHGEDGRSPQLDALPGIPYRDACGRCGARRVDSQLGLEATPDQYVERMVAVFREVWRVLRDDGTVWLNLGDSYANTGFGGTAETNGGFTGAAMRRSGDYAATVSPRKAIPNGLKPKDLVGIPWAVAKALQAPHYDGRIKAERDRVWLAATMDAEGSICGFHHTRKDDGSTRTGIHVTITNTSMALLAEAQRIWPTSRDDGYAHGSSALGDRECRRWIAIGVDDKALLLREIYPYLIAKRQQALLAWNFLEMSKLSKRIGKIAEGHQAKERRSWIVHALSALNRGDGIDVPNWIVEPPSLFQDGWYLRSDIVWSKPNPMPESVSDRPTKAHEYLFLLAKRPRYYMDMDAIREPAEYGRSVRLNGDLYAAVGSATKSAEHGTGTGKHTYEGGRNRRSVWTIPTEPFPQAHFATYPQALVRPCILAGTSEHGECSSCGAPWVRQVDVTQEFVSKNTVKIGDARRDPSQRTDLPTQKTIKHVETTGWRASCTCDAATRPQTVLDPFIGSGTTALVARNHARRCIGIDLSTEYLAIAAKRLQQLSLFANPLGHSEDTLEPECA